MPYVLLIFILLFISSCSDISKESKESKQDNEVNTKTVDINSIEDLNQLFDDLNYTADSWKDAKKEIPRLSFLKISEAWKQTSDEMPVQEKKNIFFRLLAPLVLMSNEEILKDRNKLLAQTKASPFVKELAIKYKVIKKDEGSLSEKQYQELVKRVDIIPMSLALAQGAEESGWGTSRFAMEGNALFGLWTYNGDGMAPAQQREGLGDYGLAKYETPLDSVQAYMLNLNISYAYEKFRDKRQELRINGDKITGWELAQTLDKYSERGEDYIKGLHNMIIYNGLEATDESYLSNISQTYLIKATQ